MITVQVECEYTAAPVGAGRPSERVVAVASMFGLGLDDARRVSVVPSATVPLEPGGVVFVTGPSGSGKSTLLRCLMSGVPGVSVLDFSSLEGAAEVPLIDALPTSTLEGALRLLAQCGLNDAFVMLRRPSELSDGQRYRFALARLMAAVELLPKQGVQTQDEEASRLRAVVIADEFGATLDRLTAKVIARNIRKWATRSGVCVVVATTHDDLLEALDPDVLVEQGLGRRMEVVGRGGVGKGS